MQHSPRFESDKHISSWAGMAPGQNESAGKRKSENIRKGSKYLRSTLVESAKVCGKSKTFLGNKYQRIRARRGSNRAAIVVGHAILIIVYHILKTKKPYKDLGQDFHLENKRNYEKKRAMKKLEKLGYTVELTEVSA